MLRLDRQTKGRQPEGAVLSGGVFQNKILTESTVKTLESLGFTVFLPSLIPPNDGGISLGQAYIAMEKLKWIG